MTPKPPKRPTLQSKPDDWAPTGSLPDDVAAVLNPPDEAGVRPPLVAVPDPDRAGTAGSARRGGSRQQGGSGPSGRDLLIALVEKRFTVGRTLDDRPFLIERDGPNVALYAGQAKSRMSVMLRELAQTTAPRTALDEVWMLVEGRAAAVDKSELPLRTAPYGPGYVIDMGDPQGRAIVVTAAGWTVVDRSPVTFRRSRATGTLPTPVRGAGGFDALWHVVNVAPEYRPLVRAWLVSLVVQNIPHVIVRLTGEQGAAKTTTAEILGTLLDPSSVAVLSVPRDRAQWEVTANARWVIPVDNVSKIDAWWSDELCRTATGAGVLDRALYTDGDVTTKFLRACPILNGIGTLGTLRGDLAERMLTVDLVRPTEYRSKRDIDKAFTGAHPGILAALLDDVARVLANMPTAVAPPDLRMADFARVMAAFDGAPDGPVLQAYRAQHAELLAETLETDAVALTVLHLMELHPDGWSGSASDLHAMLDGYRRAMVERSELPHDGFFPKDGPALGRAIVRSGPTLRANGVTYTRARTMTQRTLTVAPILPAPEVRP